VCWQGIAWLPCSLALLAVLLAAFLGAYARGSEECVSVFFSSSCPLSSVGVVEIPCLWLQYSRSFSEKVLIGNSFPIRITHLTQYRRGPKENQVRFVPFPRFYPRVVHNPVLRDFLICWRCVLCICREVVGYCIAVLLVGHGGVHVCGRAE